MARWVVLDSFALFLGVAWRGVAWRGGRVWICQVSNQSSKTGALCVAAASSLFSDRRVFVSKSQESHGEKNNILKTKKKTTDCCDSMIFGKGTILFYFLARLELRYTRHVFFRFKLPGRPHATRPRAESMDVRRCQEMSHLRTGTRPPVRACVRARVLSPLPLARPPAVKLI